MAREKGTFSQSANYELQKEGTIDARQFVDVFADLLNFTASNYIAEGFPVTVRQDSTYEGNTYKKGWYQFLGGALNDANNWEFMGGSGVTPFDPTDLKIGGRNYLPNFHNPKWNIDSGAVVDRYSLHFPANSGNPKADIILDVESNTNYTFTFNSDYARYFIREYNGGAGDVIFSGSEPETTFNTDSLTKIILIIDTGSGNRDKDRNVSNVKLEKGNVATDWTPAPEDKADKDADLSEFKNESADPYVRNSELPAPFNPTYLENEIQNLEDTKVDKDGDKQLSDENYTTAEKDKLAGLESSKWLGVYPNLTALETAHPTANAGNYADVDAGVGVDTVRYVWDVSDTQWVQSGSGAPLTPSQIKQMYESNPDTNAFDDSRKSKLDSITAIFTTALKNAYDNVVNWVSTNGQNILDHISSPHAPADAEKNRPFGQSEDTVMEGDDDRIVNGGVVRESVLLTSKDDIDDITTPGHYHTFEGDVANNFPTEYGGTMKVLSTGDDGEIFQLVYDVHNELLSRSYFEGAFTDWNRYAPAHWVNSNFAKLSDIYKENAVLDGDWFLKPNTEDTYNVIAREYIINKVLYTDTITGEVTRAPRHATLRRWDMITVEADHTFLITSGVPALDPTRPIPNKQQAVLTYIFVSAIADAPPTPTFLLLYDENVGEPAEANVTTGSPSIVILDSTEAPFQGTKHILFNERVSDTESEAVVFSFTTMQRLSNYRKLIMHMASGYGGADNNHFLIHVKNADNVIASFSSSAISWSPTGVGTWERGVLDMSEYANIPNDEFDNIVIDASNGPGYDSYIQEGSKLDYIFLTEKDDTTPVNPVVIQRTSEIPINDGATGVSPYAEMRDLDNKLDKVTTGNQERVYAVGIGNDQKMMPTIEQYVSPLETAIISALKGATYTNNIAVMPTGTIDKGRKYIDVSTGDIYEAFEDDQVIKY